LVTVLKHPDIMVCNPVPLSSVVSAPTRKFIQRYGDVIIYGKDKPVHPSFSKQMTIVVDYAAPYKMCARD